MPDIEMCQNEECPLKKKCYRFTAIPSPHLQAYNYFKLDEDGQCDYYWDNKKYDENYEEK